MDKMRSSFLFCAALAVAVLSCAAVLGAQAPAAAATPATPVENWQAYSYPVDGFSVAFPSAPVLAKQNVPTAAGTFELRTYMVEPASSALYVGICDYGSAAAGRDPNSVLQGAENGAITNISGHLISSDKITLGIYPGLAFEGENSSMYVSARIYLVGTTLYQSLTASPLNASYPESKRFLDSFQLIARVQK